MINTIVMHLQCGAKHFTRLHQLLEQHGTPDDVDEQLAYLMRSGAASMSGCGTYWLTDDHIDKLRTYNDPPSLRYLDDYDWEGHDDEGW